MTEPSVYVPLKVSLLSTAGLQEAMTAMRLPKPNSESDTDEYGLGFSDADLARRLVLAGPDHAKAMRGIVAYLDMYMQTGWMIEFETYRHGVECLSTTSSMHDELKPLRGFELAEKKQRDLPSKVYRRIVMISYQALRAMYKARRYHKHPDWQIFCDFIQDGIPYFDYLIYPEFNK